MIISYSQERKDIDGMIRTIDDVFGGNFFIKKDISKYLVQAPGEENDQFKRRSKKSVFYNFLKPIIRLAAERPFSNKITYSDNFPKQFEPLKKNFDGLGNGLLFKAFESFQTGIKHASIGFVADFDNDSRMPFARAIGAKDIIGIWKKIMSDGSYYYERVQFIVRNNSIRELQDEFGNVKSFEEVKRSKIIELIHPNIMRTYNVVKENYINTDKASFECELIEEIELTGFDKIPFHLFTTEQPVSSEYTIKIIPTFYDLAQINLSHYNKQSDQDNIMTVSRYAILCATGVTEEDFEDKVLKKGKNKIIGPFSLLMFSNPTAKVFFAEHKGNAIAAGQNDIIKTEKAMTSLLKDYLQRQVIMETATEKNLAEKHQNLYTIYLANKLEQTLTKVFVDFAKYMGITIDDTENLLSFSRDYSAAETSKKIDSLLELRKMGDISQVTLLNELAALGNFSGEFDPEDEKERIATEDGENTNPNNEPSALNENDPEGDNANNE